MKYFKVLAYFLISVMMVIALLMVTYALFMKYSDTGTDCHDISYEKIENLIKGFHKSFPETFSIGGFSKKRDFEYIEGGSGDVILQPFETDSGYYRAIITCDGGVDIAPWHDEK